MAEIDLTDPAVIERVAQVMDAQWKSARGVYPNWPDIAQAALTALISIAEKDDNAS
jgi:hypothetical protein